MRLLVHAPILTTVALLAGLALAAEEKPPSGGNVDMRWGARIPMRDGATLNATVYQPQGQKDRLPAIFTLTPYIGDSYLERALYLSLIHI